MNIYKPLWERYLKVIRLQMKNASNGEKEIAMSKHEFEELGNRKISDYTFNIEIKNGKVSNNIKNQGASAVCRDLFEVLKENNETKVLLSTLNYKFTLGKEYILRINVL